MQRLTQEREVNRVLLDRRILDVTQAVFAILETAAFRELSSELDHLRRVIDRDDLARFFGQQLRKRPLTRAKIGNRERREERDHRMRQRLPGATRTITATEPARQLVKIFARFVLTLAQDHLERRAIALGLRHFARERPSQLTDSGALRVELLTVGQPVIDVFSRAAILHNSSPL